MGTGKESSDATQCGPDMVRLCRGEEGWPAGLATIEVEPAHLWLRGRRALLGAQHTIAIVGSRAPTPYGVSQAERFGRELAAAGACVISGLARGVDSAAHTGALDAGGATIGVLGCGVDEPWPAGPLANRMASEGLLVSEFDPGTRPRRHHFPLRNRIIAALADAVLVVEAAHASGSLITARWASDQGQQVFALPGRVDHPMARGTLRLMREGATPVDSPAMLIDDLYGEGSLFAPSGAPSDQTDGATAAGLDDAKLALLGALRGETRSAAELSTETNRRIGDVVGDLMQLELRSLVQRVPGGLYQLR